MNKREAPPASRLFYFVPRHRPLARFRVPVAHGAPSEAKHPSKIGANQRAESFLVPKPLDTLRSTVVRTIGRVIKRAAKLRGGGSALPGLITERIDPGFMGRTLSQLPLGVIVVSGTNGKTTTTKMLAQLLRDSGLKVFTNPTGSNFTRGITASLLDATTRTGRLPADIAVLELDEAHAVHFVKRVKPRHCLLLNVLRDQLDRFGEIDYTASLLRHVAAATTETVVLNREDPLIASLAADTQAGVTYFGYDHALARMFPNDSALHDGGDAPAVENPLPASVSLVSFAGRDAVFSFDGEDQASVTLKLDGAYNVLNAAAALATARAVLPPERHAALLESVATVRPAFGRGEAIVVDGHALEIVLVKNPSGFRLALRSYVERPADTMIVINDQYADGRDMSWLWDVDIEQLPRVDMVSGVRAYDMALRLQYGDVPIGEVAPSIPRALDQFTKGPARPRRIYTTYTAMLEIRRHLAKSHTLEPIE
ncbi:DUF1727 domain-containing protein [Micrococcales bacterium 31B]|nr:DUF1727 domain-containing protein [Micrococcales bacterium 31B]